MLGLIIDMIWTALVVGFGVTMMTILIFILLGHKSKDEKTRHFRDELEEWVFHYSEEA